MNVNNGPRAKFYNNLLGKHKPEKPKTRKLKLFFPEIRKQIQPNNEIALGIFHGKYALYLAFCLFSLHVVNFLIDLCFLDDCNYIFFLLLMLSTREECPDKAWIVRMVQRLQIIAAEKKPKEITAEKINLLLAISTENVQS